MNLFKRLSGYLCLLSAVFLTACGDKSKESKEQINIYVTPFYDSTPLQINIGKYSDELKSDSPRKMLELADEIKECIDEVNAITLYVLAIRLYNLGEKDASVYWFYNAQFRGRILLNMAKGLSPTGAPAALDAFQSLSGTWINGYAFGDPDKTLSILEQVIKDVRHMGYIQNAYPGYTFRPESEQQEIVDEQIEGLRKFMKYMDENREEILRQRIENGIKGKY
ncbi:MAG: hypothetical protein LBV72_13380 [Tannerella sp.]|nr:hypothetical protein [Tannerella sp.]